MGTFALTDTHVYLDYYDLTCSLTELQLSVDADMLDETTFCNDTHKMRPGLLKNNLSYKGFLDFSEITTSSGDSMDQLHQARIGLETPNISVMPNGAAAGDYAYFGTYTFASYATGAEVGQMLPFSLSAQGRNKLSRGVLMLPAETPITVSAASAKRQLGAVPTGSQLVAMVHVVAFTGTTLDIDIRSDANASAGGETVRGSFTQIAGVTSQRVVVAAPITDAYWDVNLTFVGTSVTLAIALAIQTTP